MSEGRDVSEHYREALRQIARTDWFAEASPDVVAAMQRLAREALEVPAAEGASVRAQRDAAVADLHIAEAACADLRREVLELRQKISAHELRPRGAQCRIVEPN